MSIHHRSPVPDSFTAQQHQTFNHLTPSSKDHVMTSQYLTSQHPHAQSTSSSPESPPRYPHADSSSDALIDPGQENSPPRDDAGFGSPTNGGMGQGNKGGHGGDKNGGERGDKGSPASDSDYGTSSSSGTPNKST